MESGTKLGHYAVLSLLGKGGMGEIWRARDAKLGREVAIKTVVAVKEPAFLLTMDRIIGRVHVQNNLFRCRVVASAFPRSPAWRRLSPKGSTFSLKSLRRIWNPAPSLATTRRFRRQNGWISFNLTVPKIREDLLSTVGGNPVSNEEARQHSVDREPATNREAFGLESPEQFSRRAL